MLYNAPTMSAFWSDGIADLEPYVPGEQPRDRRYVKLNTNENPYPPSPAVLAAIRDAANDDLRLYPDPTCDALRAALARAYGLKPEQTFVGNGSDEVLAFCFPAFFRRRDAAGTPEPLLYPDITYSFYPVYSKFFGIEARRFPLADDFSVPLQAYLQPAAGAVVCNPNAPTSRPISRDEVRRVASFHLARNRVVLVDEAYVDFGGESSVGLVDEFPNLAVVHTMSKSRALAGLRVGFAFGQSHLIEALERVKSCVNSYTIDRLAMAGAIAALGDTAWFQETRRKVMATREWVVRDLRALGFTVPASGANFIFVSHPDHAASDLFAGLRARGILVRYFAKPRIDRYLRVSIGSDDDMRAFLDAIRALVAP